MKKNIQTKKRKGDIGFETGFKVDTVLGAKKEDDGELYLYVSWIGTDGYCSFVPAKLAHKKIPQKLIAFYESRIQLIPQFDVPGQLLS